MVLNSSLVRTMGKSASEMALGTKSVLSTTVKTMGVGGIIGGISALGDVKENMNNGNNLGTSVFKAGVTNALWTTNPALMMTLNAGPAVIKGYEAAHQFRRRRGEELQLRNRGANGMVGTGFQDTQQAYTMRQAAVQQIQGNKMNARSALGGEARIFGSQYRR